MAARHNPTVETTKGRLAARQAADLLARRWSRATPDMKALAVLEEAATGLPLIAGNKVTLLFDGPRHHEGNDGHGERRQNLN